MTLRKRANWNATASALIALLALSGCAMSAEILIGQVADFTGPAAANVAELVRGARLCIDQVNRQGGVHGRTITIVRVDDGNDPRLTAAVAQQLVADPRVLMLFQSRGTPQTESLLPLLARHELVLLAPSTGAMSLRVPVNRWVFNVRSSYQRESERAIKHLLTLGVTRIALVRVNDSFGRDAAKGAGKALNTGGLHPVIDLEFDRDRPDFEKALPRVLATDPQAVLMLGSAAAVAAATRWIRAAGHRSHLLTLSNNASAGFIKLLGDDGFGMIVTQVFPPERSLSVPAAREAYELSHGEAITPAIMEGFVSAKVLVEALRRAGPNPTRLGVERALNTMRQVDLGGIEISYSPQDHMGMNYIDIAVISSKGSFVR